MTFAGIVGQLILGWLLADLVTGAFHWWEDNFGSEDWPIVGPWIIRPNRLHHRAPLAFTSHGFMARNRAAIVAALLAGTALTFLCGPEPWIAALVVGAALSNEVHRYAHEPSSAPAWIRVVQQIGLFQSPKDHACHHRPPHDVNFCILTDWLNPVLEALGIWKRLGRLFGRPA
jgi:ubiquitin-conjugating enzyme E2 variant